MIIYVYFIAIINVCQGQLTGMLKDLSCVKNGDHLYVLGGEINNGAWKPLDSVYQIELNQLRVTKSNNNLPWLKQELEGYKPPAYLSYTSASTDDTIFYYGLGDSQPDSMKLKRIQLANKRVENLARGTQFQLGKTSHYKIKFHSPIQTSLFMNDLNRNQVIFIGGNVVLNGQHYFGDSINIFDLDSLTWKTLLTYSLNGKRTISAVYNGILYFFGSGVNMTNILDHHVIPNHEKETSLLLAVYEIGSYRMLTRISTGDVPPLGIDYSYTQVDHMLYLVGDNNGHKGNIYALNLKTKVWSVSVIPNFTGYELGCLTFHDNTLFHYFGQNNRKSVQTIDISKLTTGFQPESTTDNLSNEGDKHHTLVITISCISGFLAIVMLITLLFIIWRRRTKLKPPKLLNNFVADDGLTNPLKDEAWLLKSTTTSIGSDSELFKITELKPDECFKNDKVCRSPLVLYSESTLNKSPSLVTTPPHRE